MAENTVKLGDGNGGTLTYTLQGVKELPEGEFRQYQFYRDLDQKRIYQNTANAIENINKNLENVSGRVELALRQHNECPLLKEKEILKVVANETKFKNKLKKKIRNRIIFWSILLATALNIFLLVLHSKEIIRLF